MGTEHEGAYGRWRLEENDENEVVAYRSGLGVAAAGALCGAVGAFVPDVGNAGVQDVGLIMFACGLGISVFSIHVYVAQAKLLVQTLWGFGCVCCIIEWLMDHDVSWLANRPLHAAITFGPLAAAMTGLALKEAVCYGRASAAVLGASLPICMLGLLLSGNGDGSAGEGNAGASVAWTSGGLTAVAMLVFAAGKWSQPIADDVGDKSVFRKIREEEINEREMELLRRERVGEDVQLELQDVRQERAYVQSKYALITEAVDRK